MGKCDRCQEVKPLHCLWRCHSGKRRSHMEGAAERVQLLCDRCRNKWLDG